MRAAIVLVCLLLAAGCDEASPVGPTVGLNERFTLAPAEIAVISDVGLRVEFVDVGADSRCPAGVLCIQAGDALVHIRVIEGTASSSYDLHTGDSNRAAIVHGSVRIALAELQPYPFINTTIAPGEYRATFIASRL
ncbi:MAG TPA: hypothetical protein VGF24_35420 [Vicinamibacterales bacterium]